MDPNQYDLLHDDAVASDFAQRVRFPEIWGSPIKDYSLFVAKHVPFTKFEEGKVYIGTRACAEDRVIDAYEESVVLYINERYVNNKGQQCVEATVVYREILKRDKESDEATYVQIIYDHNLNTYSSFYVLEEIDGVETLLYNKQYSLADFGEGLEDLSGVRIPASQEAELRGWWQIENNWKMRLSNDPSMPF